MRRFSVMLDSVGTLAVLSRRIVSSAVAVLKTTDDFRRPPEESPRMPAMEGRLLLPASSHFCPKPRLGLFVSEGPRLPGRGGLFGDGIAMVSAAN